MELKKLIFDRWDGSLVKSLSLFFKPQPRELSLGLMGLWLVASCVLNLASGAASHRWRVVLSIDKIKD